MPHAPSQPAPRGPEGDGGGAGRGLLAPLLALFFLWGLATVLVDIVTPELKRLFALSFAQATLTQFSFFIAYAVVSLPAGALVARIGSMRGLVAGLLVTASGCLTFAPAARLGLFPVFLVALFVMAAGIAVLQVAANPLVARLGPAAQGASRLTLAQTFNALGTTVGPVVGAWAILSRAGELPDPATASVEALAAARQAEAAVLQGPFLALAACLGGLAALFWTLRGRIEEARGAGAGGARGLGLDLLARPRLALGALAIFLYVGAEVSIGTLMVSYLEQPEVLGASPERAGRLLSLYWGGALAGRVVGSFVLRRVRAGLALGACALCAAGLACMSGLSSGTLAAGTLLAVGLANAILFPTTFALAIDGLGARAAEGAGIVCVAIVGGAVVPVMTGALADRAGLSPALVIPALCYLGVAAYGIFALRPAPAPDNKKSKARSLAL